MLRVSEIFERDDHLVNLPLFIFKRCHLAATPNAKILERFNFNLDTIIHHQHPSQISYGSEFRSLSVLGDLLSDHPFWPRLKEILDNGANFPLEPISKENRLKDLAFHKEWGNHRSLSKFSSFIDPVITEDIECGFTVPLSINTLDKLPNASLAPLGCHKQTTINALDEMVQKYCLTHDQSFPGPSGSSVNLRVKKNLIPPIRYSFVLSRLIHYIVNT
jgi:hypothetical protein